MECSSPVPGVAVESPPPPQAVNSAEKTSPTMHANRKNCLERIPVSFPRILSSGAMVEFLHQRPCSSVDRAPPSGGGCRCSSRRRGACYFNTLPPIVPTYAPQQFDP